MKSLASDRRLARFCAAIVFCVIDAVRRAINKRVHLLLQRRGVFKLNVVPYLAAAREHSLPVEYPAALKARNGDPIRLASKIRDDFTLLSSYPVHVRRDWFRPDLRGMGGKPRRAIWRHVAPFIRLQSPPGRHQCGGVRASFLVVARVNPIRCGKGCAEGRQ